MTILHCKRRDFFDTLRVRQLAEIAEPNSLQSDKSGLGEALTVSPDGTPSVPGTTTPLTTPLQD